MQIERLQIKQERAETSMAIAGGVICNTSSRPKLAATSTNQEPHLPNQEKSSSLGMIAEAEF